VPATGRGLEARTHDGRDAEDSGLAVQESGHDRGEIGADRDQDEGTQEERRRGKKASAGTTPARIRCEPSMAVGTGYKCKLGRMILMMGTLASAVGTEAREKRSAYEGIQGLLESVAMGIEEKQMEMREMDRSLSAKRMELIELEKTVWRRQMLLNLT
jgi:hypothetical protein